MTSTFTNAFTALPTTPWPADVSYQKITLTGDLTLTFPSSFGTSPNVIARSMDVDSNNALNTIYLSSADQVSIGFDFVISNIGSLNFILANSNSDEIVLITPGSSYIVQLTSKTTPAGTWSTIQLGYVTAAPNASALAGYGLTPLNGKLNTNNSVTRINSSYILDPSDRAKMFIWEGGNGILKLPNPAAINVRNGFYISVNNASLGGGTVTIIPYNTELIDNLASFPLNPAETAEFTTDGTNWFSLGYGTADFFTYEVLDLDISGFSGGTLILTSQEAAKTIHEFRGVLTGEVEIVYPTTPNVNDISNFTTGGYDINLTTTNETPIPVRPSQKVICVTNGEIMYKTPSTDSTEILFDDGTALLPSITFASDVTDGIYHPGAGQLGFTCAASQVAQMSEIGIQLIPGTAGAPSYSFLGASDVGIGNPATDTLNVQAVNTWLKLGVNSLITSFDGGSTNTVTMTPAGIKAVPGSISNVSYGFIGRATNLGFLSSNDGELDMQAGAFTATLTSTGVNYTYDTGGSTSQYMTIGGFYNVSGSASVPSYSFGADSDSGLWFSPAGGNPKYLGLSVDGALKTLITATGLQALAGTIGDPSLSFIGNSDVGLAAPNANILSVVAGTEVLNIGDGVYGFTFDSGVTSIVKMNVTGLQLIDGTAAAPSYGFQSDTDDGMYLASANNLGLAAGGSQIVNINPTGIQVIPGTVNNVTYGFIGRAANVGMYSPSSGLFELQAANFTTTLSTLGINFTYDNGITSLQTIRNSGFYNVAGSAGSPSYSFDGQPAVGAFAPDIDTYATTTTNAVTVLTNNYWELSVASGGYNFRIDATTVNATSKSYQQDGINIFSLMRAYA